MKKSRRVTEVRSITYIVCLMINLQKGCTKSLLNEYGMTMLKRHCYKRNISWEYIKQQRIKKDEKRISKKINKTLYITVGLGLSDEVINTQPATRLLALV